jgi:type II secretory pathway pseudopilin PulG
MIDKKLKIAIRPPHATRYRLHAEEGFTLMEIVVATTIFILAITAMMTLFTYTLKINRKGDAMRQATQGMRNFTEFLTKEIRNGKIDYGTSPIGSCPSTQYTSPSNALALINLSGQRECIWWDATAKTLMLQKEGTNAYSINPQNFTVENLRFYVRPELSPYIGTPPPRTQPFVTMLITFQVRLSAGESPIIIPYQTSVSSDVYDIPQ